MARLGPRPGPNVLLLIGEIVRFLVDYPPPPTSEA